MTHHLLTGLTPPGPSLSTTMHTILQYYSQGLHKILQFLQDLQFLYPGVECLSAIERETRTEKRGPKINENVKKEGQLVKL